jgi:hypothetical protein
MIGPIYFCKLRNYPNILICNLQVKWGINFYSSQCISIGYQYLCVGLLFQLLLTMRDMTVHRRHKVKAYS